MRELVFWYTGAAVWGVIGLVLFAGMALAVTCAVCAAYFRATRWLTIWYLCRWTKTPRANRTALFQELRVWSGNWLSAGRAERRGLTAKQFEQCVDQLGFHLLHKRDK